MDHLKPSTLEAIKICVSALEDKKAEAIRIFNLKGKSSITDVVIIATGNSEPHLKALSNALEGVVRDYEFSIAGVDYQPQSGWLVVDAYQIMLHLMLPEKRQYYRLEELWSGAQEIPLDSLRGK